MNDGANIHVTPVDVDLQALPGETIMAAAQRSGYRWPTVCGGQGTCRTCYVIVEQGAENCSGISQLEAEGIAAIAKTVKGEIRLACQVKIENGSAVVHKRGVRPLKPQSPS